MSTTSTPLNAVPEKAQLYIDRAYDALGKQPEFLAREGQRLLSRLVCASLLTGKPLAAEAPTGTGKTLAYIIGMLAAKQVAPDTDPVVVATATKALQAQLMQSDLPKLAKAGCISTGDFALAKGKGNYLCLRDAKELQRLGAGLFDDVGSEDELPDESASIDVTEVDRMVADFESGAWDGDFDAFMGAKPRSLIRIQVKGETCSGQKCEYHNTCAYVRARAAMTGATAIIANHDLVLADLQMHVEDDSAFFPAARYMLVVDEAHNFPEKAIAVGQREVNVVDALNRVFKLRTLVGSLSRHPELAVLLKRPGIAPEIFEAKALIKAFQGLLLALDDVRVDDQSGQLRFSGGVVPKPLLDAALEVARQFPQVSDAVASVLTGIVELPPMSHPAVRKSLVEATHLALSASKAMKQAYEGIAAFTGPKRCVRWVSKADERTSIHTSPIYGADVLKPLLWDSNRATPAFVSATLRDLDGFGRFQRSCGMPASSHFEVLPYIFPYAESQIVIPAMSATPKQAERVAYLAELRKKLPAGLNPKEATLVLVPSRVMLREVVPMLKSRFGDDAVLVQGETAIKPLLAKHQRRVAQGLPSILVGMVTMAEGLDLPGKLCEHVVVLALPFAVPTDPVEQELAEVMGSRYFGERSLPDATTRLLQMVGRLLRRESDRGRITIYDRRLASTSYGRRMLAALPPFKKVIEPMAS
jgi:ATP-dependent DNA helicase DinG